jgi:heme A synthase
LDFEMSIVDSLWLGFFIVVAVIVLVFWFQAKERAAVDAGSQSITDRALSKFPQYVGCPVIGGATMNLYLHKRNATALVATAQGVAKEIPFSQFDSLEIQEDGHSVGITKRKGAIGRAAIGGLAFGGAGAVVGAITAGSETRQNEIVSNISVVIRTADPSFPMMAWNVFSASFGLEHQTPVEVQLARQKAQNFAGQFAPIFDPELHEGTVKI